VTRRSPASEIARVLVFTLVGVALLTAYSAFAILRQGDIDEARPADAIVVLGAAQFDGVAGGVFAARLDHAIALYKDHLAPFFIVTGGKLPGDRTTEAATARAYAIAAGVPVDAILYEDRGRSTLESMELVRGILRSHNLTSAVFVSDRSHMLRVLRMATDQGIVAFGSPTATGPIDHDSRRRALAIAHELAGLAFYYVGGGRLIDDSAVGASP
jgi:uncharacterized SAM-binding protein YcdF (DUF218 family)